jgi:ribosome maturation factor RimP
MANELTPGPYETADLDEPRISALIGPAARVEAIIAPVARDLGYRIVRVKITAQNGCTLQVMAERADGEFSINDCEALSRAMSPVLDVEDPIKSAYNLEVSSPGIDRPLVRISDFMRWMGHDAKIELNEAIDGRKRYRAFLEAIEGTELVLRLPDAPEGQDPMVRLPLAYVGEARLVLTDELVNEALRRAKAKGSESALDGAEIDPDAIEDLEVRTDKRR